MRAAAIVSVTIRQLLGGKRTWVLAALALLPALVMFLGATTFTDARAYEFANEGPLPVLMVIVTPIIALVLGTATLGEERRQDTLSFLILRPLPRPLIVAAKVGAAWLASLALTALGGLALGAAIGVRAGTLSPLLPLLVMLAINTALYVAVFAPLGYLFRRAILAGLAYVFIWENGISFVPGLAPLSLWRIGASAFVALETEARRYLDEALGSVVPGTGGALTKALVLVALGIILMTYLLQKRDAV